MVDTIKIGLDFDNTLSNAIRSDYLIYKKTCEHLSLDCSPFDNYQWQRINGKLLHFLNTQNINIDKYFAARNIISKDEHLYLDDEILVDRNLLTLASESVEFFIISKRRSLEILVQQIIRSQLPISSKNIYITYDQEKKSFVDKKEFLISLGVDIYVGDSEADMNACIGISTEFVHVETGFDKSFQYRPSFANVNDFLKNFIQRGKSNDSLS